MSNLILGNFALEHPYYSTLPFHKSPCPSGPSAEVALICLKQLRHTFVFHSVTLGFSEKGNFPGLK